MKSSQDIEIGAKPKIKNISISCIVIILSACILQGIIFGTMQLHSHPVCDEIFTYTLANTPYSYDFIDHMWKHLPKNNGWVDASVLKSNYETDSTHRFDYSGVYWHQRIDNHPLLYYSLVHTLCSFIPDKWEPYTAEFINIAYIIGIDILIIMIFIYLTGNAETAVIPIIATVLLKVCGNTASLQRMYSGLAFWALWYLFLNIRMINEEDNKGRRFVEMIAVVFLGSQTHYYFYVYAASVTIFTLVFKIRKKQTVFITNYLMSGIIGLSLSYIIFPWTVWHIWFNQMNKHKDVRGWNGDKLKLYLDFMNKQLFNGRGIIALSVLSIMLVICIVIVYRNRHIKGVHDTDLQTKYIIPDKYNHQTKSMIIGSALIYSVIIFTLDEEVWYYMTCLYLPFIIFLSMEVLHGICIIAGASNGRYSENNRHITVLRIIAAAAVMVLIFGILPVKQMVSSRIKDYDEWKVFHDKVTSYSKDDCIYIEKNKDNLLSQLWFELGEYDEIKKETLEEYGNGVISEDFVKGRNTDNNLVLFVSDDAPAPKISGFRNVKLVASSGGMSCWEIKQ